MSIKQQRICQTVLLFNYPRIVLFAFKLISVASAGEIPSFPQPFNGFKTGCFANARFTAYEIYSHRKSRTIKYIKV